MEKKLMSDAMGSSRRLLPPLYPGSGNVPRAGDPHHQNHSFQHNPAATNHFASQAGSSSGGQEPPAALSSVAHASAAVGASSNSNITVSQDIFFGSGFAGGGSSSYGGSAAGDTSGDLGSVVGLALAPWPCRQPPVSSSVGQASSESGLPLPNLTGQSRDYIDLELMDDNFVLAPLPPSLVSPQPAPPTQMVPVVDLESGDEYIDLEAGSGSGGHLNASASYKGKAPADPFVKKEVEDGSAWGNNTITIAGEGSSSAWMPMPQPYSSSNGITQPPSWTPPPLAPSTSILYPAAIVAVKKEFEDWSSASGATQLGNTIVASGGSSSLIPQPYYYGNTRNGITQARWTPPPPLAPSSSILYPAANVVAVKKEAEDWSLQASMQTITTGGSSSTWMMPQLSSSAINDLMVLGTKRKLPSSSPGTGYRYTSSGAGGSSSSSRWLGGDGTQCMYDASGRPFVPGFADGLFTQNDIDRIRADKGLADIVFKDPKQVRSILKNRTSSERTRQRNIARLDDLESQLERLQRENRSLSAQVQSTQSTATGLRGEKNELMIKLHGLQKEMQLKNEDNKTLNAEVGRLKLIVGESMASHVSNGSYQERSSQIIQPEHPRKHNHQLAQLQREQELRDLDDFFTQ